MIRKKLNREWMFTKGSPSLVAALTDENGAEYETVSLPHDAMIHEERTPDTKNGTQTGYYPGGRYTYIKKLYAPPEWQDKTVTVEFEGIYDTSMVYVNGNLAATQLYGYSGFYVTLDKYLEYGQENEILVVADNAAEQNSRWYSGSGIYRNVNLLIGNEIHIPADGVQILTLSAAPDASVAEITTDIRNISRQKKRITVETTLLYEGRQAGTDTVSVTMYGGEEETVRQTICLDHAALWSPDSPNLYECTVKLYDNTKLLDETREHFGFRKLELDAQRGLRINGESVKLRGTCIHHDNGVIGAATFEKAEERRCRQMKEAGFNSIRSSHHPMSRAMLNACDKYGMLVMDELTDMWTNHKNSNDFALYFPDCVDTEVERMVRKDFNHPSVILYSAGNEIPEAGTARGAQINRRICNLFHALDPSRYTTNAVNGMLAAGDRMETIARDIMTGSHTQNPAGEAAGGQKEEGASALNSMMALMTGKTADMMACHPLMTQTLEETCQAMDITGLNYLTGRHVLEKELHPNKPVVGTETFPADIVRLWDIVKNNNHVLGDYTWTGYDYLGEAGCGIFYYDGTQNFNGVFPDRIAYIGDINLIGYRRPISYLREIVYGLRKEPYVAVERVDKYGLPHSRTPWMWKDNVASWTWPGYEGKPALVDVYSEAEEVELFLNGTSLGRKPAGEANGFLAGYEITYEPGELLAVSYTAGKETGRFSLLTAKDDIVLSVNCENRTLVADGEDLAFITAKLTDADGTDNLFAQRKIKVTVEGAGTLQGFGSADPRAIGSYDDNVWKTFDGYVMAVIRAGTTPGAISARFEAEGCESKEVIIEVAAKLST